MLQCDGGFWIGAEFDTGKHTGMFNWQIDRVAPAGISTFAPVKQTAKSPNGRLGNKRSLILATVCSQPLGMDCIVAALDLGHATIVQLLSSAATHASESATSKLGLGQSASRLCGARNHSI